MDIYEPVIAEMKAQIEECQRVIVTLEMMRAKGASVGSQTSTTTSPIQQNGSVVTFSNDAFFNMTIGDAARKYLTGIDIYRFFDVPDDVIDSTIWGDVLEFSPSTLLQIPDA
jgi:hypothetical protein